jgi:hypothetical protein
LIAFIGPASLIRARLLDKVATRARAERLVQAGPAERIQASAAEAAPLLH